MVDSGGGEGGTRLADRVRLAIRYALHILTSGMGDHLPIPELSEATSETSMGDAWGVRLSMLRLAAAHSVRNALATTKPQPSRLLGD